MSIAELPETVKVLPSSVTAVASFQRPCTEATGRRSRLLSRRTVEPGCMTTGAARPANVPPLPPTARVPKVSNALVATEPRISSVLPLFTSVVPV